MHPVAVARSLRAGCIRIHHQQSELILRVTEPTPTKLHMRLRLCLLHAYGNPVRDLDLLVADSHVKERRSHVLHDVRDDALGFQLLQLHPRPAPRSHVSFTGKKSLKLVALRSVQTKISFFNNLFFLKQLQIKIKTTPNELPMDPVGLYISLTYLC